MRSEPALLPSRLALLVMLFATPVWAGTLDTPAQLARERALIGILKQPEMRAATARAEQVFRNDPQARSAAGGARLRVAAAALAAAATHYALGSDPSRTEVSWSVNAPHRWHGLSVPGSGFGIDNPDNVYQGFSVQGGGRYVLHGRLPVQGPVQVHLEVRDTIPGMGDMTIEASRQLATLQSEQWQYEYRHRTSSLNNAQAQRDVAGTYTFLVAPRDPGYHNWIDTSGFGLGTLVLRWQALPGTRNPADAIRAVKVLKRAELAGQLPAGQSRLSSAERRRQRAERERDYRSRLLR